MSGWESSGLKALVPDGDISGLCNELELPRGWGCTAEGEQRAGPCMSQLRVTPCTMPGRGFYGPETMGGRLMLNACRP